MAVTGIVLTKLDGTAKGGVILGIADQLKIPVRYIGVGEKVEDLRAVRSRRVRRCAFCAARALESRSRSDTLTKCANTAKSFFIA